MTDVLWNVRLLDLDAGIATERRALTIDNGLVTAIDDAEGPLPADARDLAGATVMPGLIDAHCHVLSSTADLVVVDGRPDVDLGLLTRPSSIKEVIRSSDRVK